MWTQEREQRTEINSSTQGWRCGLKRENKELRSTAVLKGGGVDSRERTKRSTAVLTDEGVDLRERKR